MRRLMPDFVPFLALLLTAASATAADRELLEQKLRAKYKLSSVNAEGEFVLKGTTLELRRGGLTGGADPVTCIHEFKDGKVSLTGPSKAACTGAVRTLAKIPGINLIPGVSGVNQTAQGNAPTTRPFVAGEKLYMTQIEIVKDDINLTMISELINMVRYRAEMRFHKAATLEVAEAENVIGEVLGIGTAGGSNGSGASSTGGAASRPAPAAAPPAAAPAPAPVAAAPIAPIPPPAAPPSYTPLPPIAPPVAPLDQPVAVVSPGMTIDQVVAMLGQPSKIADLGSKKIYSYPSQKVTFINGKVSLGDSSATATESLDLLPYEIGLGVLVVGAAAFLLGRRNRPVAATAPVPMAMAMPPGPPPVPQAAWQPPYQAPQPAPPQYRAPQPAPPPPAQPAAASQPINPIKRLDELEKLMELGVLSREEFEMEKDKLRSL